MRITVHVAGAGTHQNQEAHREQECVPHVQCGKGQLQSGATSWSAGWCGACPHTTYQDNATHTDTVCKAQPDCGRDQRYLLPLDSR